MPVDGVLPDGYVLAVEPDNGETEVAITLDTITIYYNQAMKYNAGGGSVELLVHYRLRNTVNNQSIAILNISYNPTTWVLTLSFDNTDPDWVYNTLYELWIQGSVRNECNTPQSSVVTTTFTTQLLSMDSSSVEDSSPHTNSPGIQGLATLTPLATEIPANTPDASGTSMAMTPTQPLAPSSTPKPGLTQTPGRMNELTETPGLSSQTHITDAAQSITRDKVSMTPSPWLRGTAQVTKMSTPNTSPSINKDDTLSLIPVTSSEPAWIFELRSLLRSLIHGNLHMRPGPAIFPLTLPGEHFHIEIELLDTWFCIFDPECQK